MDKLLFWILIAALGFLLYISPGYFIHRMYEGFGVTSTPDTQTKGVVADADALGPSTVNLQPSEPPKPAPPTQNQIQNLLELLNTAPPLESPTAPIQSGTASSGNMQPVEYETVRSRPESTRVIPGPSEALKHGSMYNATLPLNPQPGALGMIGAMGTQPRAPAERIVYIERPREDFPRPAVSPNCPDMREYIRKDSIPCWGCKLR
jgi:hypothetical protein